MPEPSTSLLATVKVVPSLLKHLADRHGNRALIRPGLTAPRTKAGGHGPAIMFHDPWTEEFKVSIGCDVPEPRRLELEDAVIKFANGGDKVRWNPRAYGQTAYVNARKEFVLVFSDSEVNLLNASGLDATLLIHYREEVRARSRGRYVTMRCTAGEPVQFDPRHIIPIWHLRRAGAGSWIRHGIAAFS